MRFLLDTNIVSEMRKGVRCDNSVAAWAEAELIQHGGAISVLTVGEIRKGIESIADRDPQQALTLESWLSSLLTDFDDRILQINTTIASEWGRLNAIRPLPAGALANYLGFGNSLLSQCSRSRVGSPASGRTPIAATRPS